MCQLCPLHRILIDKVHRPAGKVVQSVQILFLFLQCNIQCRLLQLHNGLIHNTGAVLDKLSHGMKICSQIDRRREDTFLILTLALPVELFPPLSHIVEDRLIICQHLNILALLMKNIADCRIQDGIIFVDGSLQTQLSHTLCSLHQPADIRTTGCYRKKSHCCEHGETAADIIRHNKGLIAFFCGQTFQRTPCLICRGIYPLCCLFFTVFLFQHFLKYTECDSRFCRGSRLTDNIHRKIPVPNGLDQLGQICSADAVAGIIDFRSLPHGFVHAVVKAMTQELYRRTGPQIRATNTDHHQYIRIRLNFLCCLLYPGKFLFVIIHWQIDPAKKIISCPFSSLQRIFCCRYCRLHGFDLVITDKS